MPSIHKIAFAVLAFAGAAAAQAATFGVTNSIAGTQAGGSIPYSLLTCAGCVNQGEHTSTNTLGTSTVTAYGMADYGVLKAGASSVGAGLATLAVANATVVFGDNFTIDAAGLTGRQGHFTAQVAMPFTSAFSGSPYGYGVLQAFVRVNGNEEWALNFGNVNGVASTAITHNDVLAAPGTSMILNVAFTYGQPIPILGFLDVQVTGETPPIFGSFDGTIDATHSVVWQGISRVTDNVGNVVSGYTMTSDSGTDWSRDMTAAPVPEPASIALLAAGLALVVSRARRSAGDSRRPSR